MSDADRHSDLGGGRTAYLERGSGEAIVFIHGVGLHSAVWRSQVDHFATRARVVAYDTLGHGRSDLPPRDATLEDYLAQLADLLDVLEIPSAVLSGHSMGAMIATAFAATRPDRVHGLVAFNTVYRRSPEERCSALERAELLAREGSAATVDAAISRWFGEPIEPEDRGRAEDLHRWLLAADPEGYARAYRVFATSDDAFADQMGALTAPALFVTGEFDPHSTPAMSRALAAEASNARAVILPGERHMFAYRSPGRASDLISGFLAETGGAATRAMPSGGAR
ncbi:alpha/beta fold hydrolase [Lutibaculum baratangense]|uniref:Beta-ketoadipate enol-lactone hydrolase n=1 Tax=Lutibaculum baratangense AMV1 TaxID=631454 RepID=V4RKG1_9HYPH|nr:alpha/beta hydrolase [Lutibaculum baratangense]ESR23745.1 Beta-ketoadipate enol-lactone hydrolase [Lutibaculum baratangense AMV1]